MTLAWQSDSPGMLKSGEYSVNSSDDGWWAFHCGKHLCHGPLEFCLRTCRFHAMRLAAQQLLPRLTERQLVLYGTILDALKETGEFPTIRAIQKALGIKSPNGVICHLTALAKKGLVVHRRSGGKRAWIVKGLEAHS